MPHRGPGPLQVSICPESFISSSISDLAEPPTDRRPLIPLSASSSDFPQSRYKNKIQVPVKRNRKFSKPQAMLPRLPIRKKALKRKPPAPKPAQKNHNPNRHWCGTQLPTPAGAPSLVNGIRYWSKPDLYPGGG